MKKRSRQETLNQFIWCHPNLDLDLENITMTDLNYHISLHGESVKNFMKLQDLQILVKECAKTKNKAIKFT